MIFTTKYGTMANKLHAVGNFSYIVKCFVNAANAWNDTLSLHISVISGFSVIRIAENLM